MHANCQFEWLPRQDLIVDLPKNVRKILHVYSIENQKYIFKNKCIMTMSMIFFHWYLIQGFFVK